MGVCNQISFLVIYNNSSRLVPLLEVINAPIQNPNIFNLTVSFKFLNFSFRYAFFLFLKCLLASCLILFRFSTLLQLESCIHCILASFLWSKKSTHSLSNHGLCCFNSRKPRLSLAEVLMFSLMFSQALFTSSSAFKFSKAANLFVISIWYYRPSNLFCVGAETDIQITCQPMDPLGKMLRDLLFNYSTTMAPASSSDSKLWLFSGLLQQGIYQKSWSKVEVLAGIV